MSTRNKQDFVYNISIYHLNDKFYITPMVRMPPIGLRTQALPLYTVADNSMEKLIEAIESAKSQSDVEFKAETKREKWDGDNGKVWNTANKSWDIFWNADGTIDIAYASPYKKHSDGVEWKYEREAEKKLPITATSLDVAREIVSQI